MDMYIIVIVNYNQGERKKQIGGKKKLDSWINLQEEMSALGWNFLILNKLATYLTGRNEIRK